MVKIPRAARTKNGNSGAAIAAIAATAATATTQRLDNAAVPQTDKRQECQPQAMGPDYLPQDIIDAARR
jgi:hypothetical protein